MTSHEGAFLDTPDRVVCIVGAGPAGLVLAHLLHQAGVSFVVLERLAAGELRFRTRAGLIENRTVELLKAYGLASPILERGSTNGVVEFRADGDELVLDYGEITNSCGHYVYPQHELVGDWADELAAAGGNIRFGARVTDMAQDDRGATVLAIDEGSGEPISIRCEIAVACDGAAGGLAFSALPSVGMSHPFRWLAVIAAAPPLSRRTIYALHASGYAAQMRRAATLTRYYLQVPPGDVLDDWPDDRIRVELEKRLGLGGASPLAGVQFVERDFVDLRVRMRDSMQLGRLFLAGDAAHLITPAGGKGMNLAVQDAIELAAGLCERFGRPGRAERLERYSATRLPAVWQAQEFSNWLLYLLHQELVGTEWPSSAEGDTAGRSSFAYRLRRARLDRLFTDEQFARWFAYRYAGVDP